MPEDDKFFQQEYQKIKRTIEKLRRDTRAYTVLLIDKAGEVITSVGNLASLDVPSFATLSAADFAATSNLASLIGEHDFKTLFHQGKKKSIYVSLIADQVILAVVYPRDTTLGMVRIKVKKASKILGTLFDRIFKELESEYSETVNDDFLSEAESELDSLFE